MPSGRRRKNSFAARIGNYEVRMLEVRRRHLRGSTVLMELFDHDAQSWVAVCSCRGIEEGVAAFQDFISR